MTNDDDLRRERAVANARILAQELARREAGGKWNRPLRLAPLVTRSDSGPSRLSRPDRATDHDRPRAAVVAWDLAHNMAARARVLADLLSTFAETDMVGALFDDFGSELWPPLRDRPNEPITFPAHGLTDFLAQAYAVAAATGDYQLLHICKPRFPGLLYGALLQRANNCSILLDIDENEQSFVGDHAPAVEVGTDELEALKRPMDEAGTALGIALGLDAPVRTVSNVALQRHLGGSIIRHARDEHDFEMSDELRAHGRELLGANERDFVILFMGTPRPHKGLDVIVEALGLLDDDFVLHVVGSTGQLGVDTSRARVVSHPLVPFSEVPVWLAGCDAIVLMQDPQHPISQFQIPAKIADGLSMGLPVVATDVPPMDDLPPNVVLRANDAPALAQRLLELREAEDAQAAIDRKALFRAEFSNTVNGARLQLLAALADDIPRETFASFVGPVLDHARAAYRFHRRRFHRENSARPDAEETGPDPSGTDLI
ncbi:MAG: glycosyltransferase, partial [Acidimicrobiia bacterium]|nr:glycosyltransferase [Acidimicrobiia bacterium]